MYYKITNGSVSYGADVVLENVDIEIKDREKIAVVGRNGCGKTTLLKAIIGEAPLEEGTGESGFSVSKSGNPVIGYLRQIDFDDENVTMLDEILKVFEPVFRAERKMEKLLSEMQGHVDEKTVKEYSAACERYEFLGGYTYKKEYSAMIKSFGFTEEDKSKSIREFSGGQRTKIAFIKLLLSKPDILLLDEPTNHLDAFTVRWLEDYLKNYKSAVVVVSHDRMFINRIAEKIYEIEYGETKCYKGNYTDFERIKRENHIRLQKEHELQRAEIERITRLIERFRYKATKAKMVQSKIKMLERMKIVDAPDRYDLKTFHADFQPNTKSAKEVLTVTGLEIGYVQPLAKIDFQLFSGQRLGVVGGNGTGKSTFLKTLVGELKALGGSFSFGQNVEIGYFDQQMAHARGNGRVIDDFHETYPRLSEFEVRSALGAFMFTGEDVFKSTADLSGGERVRLALCKILKKRPNFLILDEPTNHMDIVGKETLENMLAGYEGTVVFVSHDRYFTEKLADRILSFENDSAVFYPFGYAEYDEERRAAEAAESEECKSTQSRESVFRPKKGYFSPLKERNKKLKRIEKLETLISEAENRLSFLYKELENPEIYSDYVKVSEVQGEIDGLSSLRDGYTAEWLSLSEETAEE